ncbi:adenylate kinase 5, chloroplastic-like [Carica papaya]|uniref:adenylate kinase 5, chloroplastic-like n=1 Tax=Carica papaya TaxID=3649 RepID=UPI000B8C7B89|nr:adenylate kinase 5, chloroplastic-like [Carica papaya]
MKKIDGNRAKEAVFKEIESLLLQVQKNKIKRSYEASSSHVEWRGIPTRLNNIPHSREIRSYFYDDVLQATKRAVNDGRTRLKVRCYYFVY